VIFVRKGKVSVELAGLGASSGPPEFAGVGFRISSFTLREDDDPYTHQSAIGVYINHV
jgi:hypothetical protein